MNQLRKFVVLLVLASLIFSGLSFPLVNGAEKLTVLLSSNRVNSYTSVQLFVPLGESLRGGDWIKIGFPDSMELPDPSKAYYWKENNNGSDNEQRITLEEYILRTTSIQFFSADSIFEKVVINFKEKSILFFIPKMSTFVFQANENLLINFTCYNFMNPPESGIYYFSFSSLPEKSSKKSDPISIGPVKTSLSDVKVSVSPLAFGRAASYEIRFKTSQYGAIKPGEGYINIQFPEGTLIPDNSNLRSDQIWVNGLQPMQLNTMNSGSGFWDTLSILSPILIQGSQEVTLKFSKDLGILNPLQLGEKKLLVSTSRDSILVESDPYGIESGSPLLEVSPKIVGLAATYIMYFQLSPDQPLKKDQTLHLLIPESMELENGIKDIKVRINQELIDKQALEYSKENFTLIVPFPEDISGGSIVQVSISGFKNPAKSKILQIAYKLFGIGGWIFSEEVMLSSQESKAFSIKKFNMSSDKAGTSSMFYWEISLSGSTDIANGEYIVINFPPSLELPPDLDLTKVTIRKHTSEGEKAKYTIQSTNQSIQISFLDNIFVHTLYIYIGTAANIKNPTKPNQWISIPLSSTRKITNLELSKYYVKPDFKKLVIEYSQTISKNGWYIKSPKFTLKVNDSIDFFFINGIKILSGTTIQLPDGQYLLTLTCQEQNSYIYPKQEFVIKVDTVAPKLTLTKPDFETVLSLDVPYSIQGKIDLPYTTWFDEPLKAIDQDITINGNFVIFDSTTGGFDYPVNLTKGVNIFHIVVEDWAGNMINQEIQILYGSGIQLTIGSNQVITSGKTLTIDVPPQIKSGRTFVPIRFVGELLGAKFQVVTNARKETSLVYIDFDGHRIEMNLQTLVTKRDGKVIILDAVPYIMQGRLMVPLRFISEQMNKRVIWNPISQTILILV